MLKLSNDHVFTAFAPDLEPALTVPLGSEVTLQTRDCFADQLQSSVDTLDNLDWGSINPATGPVAFEGVRAGDLLAIYIKDLEPTGHAVVTPIPGEGAIGDHIVSGETIIIEQRDGKVLIPTAKGTLELDAKPMIGVIGLAPGDMAVPNGTPGVHGGNMDCTQIGENTTLYLRAAVDGGLFGCGDVHSIMGDGEVLVCGAESPALVTIVADKIDQPKLPVPFLETEELYAVIASASTTDDAYKLACDLMMGFLTDIVGLRVNDAGMLMSLIGNLKFCQVVDPQVTVRFEMPKEPLARLGFLGLQ